MGSREKVLLCPREPAVVGLDAAPTAVSGMPEGGRPRASARASDGGNGGVRGQPAAPPLPAFLRQIQRLGEHAWLARTATAVARRAVGRGQGDRGDGPERRAGGNDDAIGAGEVSNNMA
uniref:Uncharacterized protein n=1 Tax=Setaria viridis TaxID=4556 RepID=A0A4U6T052_SETVI|nr:hypothetical protein SEVIR_9G319766v2 [Setaria viridis]